MALPVDNYQSSLALTQFLPLSGIFPPRSEVPDPHADLGGIPLGAIRTVAGNFAPGDDPPPDPPFGGSATAEGQLVPLAQNTALFSLLGFMYGGNGTSMFALPDLDGRTMIGAGAGTSVGAAIGSSGATLSNAQLPSMLGGSSQPIDNYQPSLPITYLIRTAGIFPSEFGGTAGVDFIGQIVPFAGNFAPDGFLEAAGQTLQIADYNTLFSLIGTTYGGDGQTTFMLPDLRGRTIVGTSSQVPLGLIGGEAQATLSNANLPASVGGSGQPIDNHQPSLALTYLIALQGIFPSPDSAGVDPTQQYLGEIVAFAGNFAPKGWAKAEGQLLPINQNQALFSLLGTQYGGNGQTLFALPDLRNRTAVGTGDVADVGDILGSNDATILPSNIFDAQFTGTSDPNALNGGDGNDSLDGAGGADAMTGGAGNDVYFVDNAGDAVIENAGQGNDVVFSTAHLALSANVEILNLQGSADLQGYGNGLVNTLTGNTGNNLLDGRAGADAMTGGAGNDVYFVDDAGDTATESAGQGTDAVFASAHFALSANVETLVLQGGANLQGYGNGLVNTLIGNTGSNLLDGGAGADGMTGGAGNDVYFVDNAGDTATESAGQGTDAVFASAHFALSANVETLVLQGVADLQGYGNDLVNKLIGNTGSNLLDGRTGADTMLGGLGDDVYFVDNAGDTATESAGQGNDLVFASAHFALSANVESLALQGSADLQGYGNGLVNTLIGNTGSNLLDGRTGADTMLGGLGDDVYFVDDAGDVVSENAGQGTDTIFATFHVIMAANVEQLVLQGSANLGGTGNALANTIFGNSGDNTLDGQGAADMLTGDAGNDTFVFNVGQGNGDTVVDFAGNGAAAGDSLRFVGYGTAVQGATFTQIGVTNQWLIHSGLGAPDETITFMNGASVHATDYIFM